MEIKAKEWESKTLINELNQGKELAKQLRNHLSPSSSLENRQFLVEKILSSYEKALSILKWNGFAVDPKATTVSTLESPNSIANSSPRSDVSDQDCKDTNQCHKEVFKKRKTQPRWTEQVQVCPGTGLEGPLLDGYSWRKYGQKDILGANFPRGYYRCTHRHSQGCLATKQVQRSDSDPTVFKVSYRGRHTCIQSPHLAMASVPLANDGTKQSKDLCQQQQQQHEEKPKPSSQETILSFADGLKVKTEDLDTRDDIFPSFRFPGNEIDQENNIFAESMRESNFLASFPPTFMSPTTSESNYFSISPPCYVNRFGIGHSVGTPESELTDRISAATSVTNSPIPDLDIPTYSVNLDSNFSLDDIEFFS